MLLDFYLMGTGAAAVANVWSVGAVTVLTFYTTSAFFNRAIHHAICPPKNYLESS